MHTCLPLLSCPCLLAYTHLCLPVHIHLHLTSDLSPSVSLAFRIEKCASKQPKNELSSRNIVQCISSTSFFLCAHTYFSVVQIHATCLPIPLSTVTCMHLPTPAFPPCLLAMCTCLHLLCLCLHMCMHLHLHVFAPIHLPPCTVVPAPACLPAWVCSLYFFFLYACAHSKSSLPPSLSGSCHPNTIMGNIHMCNGCKMLTFLPLATPTCHTYAMAHFPTLGHACCVYAIVHLPALGHAHLLHLHHGTSSCWLCPPAMPAPLSHPWLYLPALALLSHLCLPAFMHLPHLCTYISATPSCHAPHQLLYSEEPTIC